MDDWQTSLTSHLDGRGVDSRGSVGNTDSSLPGGVRRRDDVVGVVREVSPKGHLPVYKDKM